MRAHLAIHHPAELERRRRSRTPGGSAAGCRLRRGRSRDPSRAARTRSSRPSSTATIAPGRSTCASHQQGPAISPAVALRQRAVVFLDELAELLRHFVRARDQRAIGVVADLAAQAVFEALQPFGDERLEPQQLVGVAIDAPVLELAQPPQDLVELARIDVLLAQQVAQLAALAGPAARFVTELTNLVGTEPVARPPAAPPARPIAPAAVGVAAAGLPIGLAATVGAIALTALALLTLLTPAPAGPLASALLALLALLTLLALLAFLALLPLAALLARCWPCWSLLTAVATGARARRAPASGGRATRRRAPARARDRRASALRSRPFGPSADAASSSLRRTPSMFASSCSSSVRANSCSSAAATPSTCRE